MNKVDLDELENLDSLGTAPPWVSGGPVKRASIEHNGLSATTWEIAQDGDEVPPGICVVNDYFLPSGRSKGDQRTAADKNAKLIEAMRNALPDMIAELRASRKLADQVATMDLDMIGLAMDLYREEVGE